MATPEQERNLELARTGIEAWMAGDVERTMSTFTDDIEVYVPTELANAGSFRGREGFLSWIKTWAEAWSEFTYELEEVVPVGDRHVVAVVLTRGRGRGSGIEVEQTRGWVLEIRGELCSYLSLQRDGEAAIEFAREREGVSGDQPVSSR